VVPFTAGFHKQHESMNSFGSSRRLIAALISCARFQWTLIEVALWKWRLVADRKASIITVVPVSSVGCPWKQCFLAKP